jgi:hypothetical protein
MSNQKQRLAMLLWLAAAACRDPSAPPAGGDAVGTANQRVACLVRVSSKRVDCVDPNTGKSFSNIIIGGPNGNRIRLTSSNPTVVADSFLFDVTVRNLGYERLGSYSISPDTSGIRVFFIQPPTVTARVNPSLPASIQVANEDGRTVFLTDSADFYKYRVMLYHCETSPPRKWIFQFDENVAQFEFEVMLSAEVTGDLSNTCEHDQGGGS